MKAVELQDASFYKSNRAELMAAMPSKSIAVFCSNDVVPYGADGAYPFRQQADIRYLTGMEQANTYLILFPDAPLASWREVLFVTETNETIALWEGEKHSKASAAALSGIERVEWSDGFWAMLKTYGLEAETIMLNLNEHDRNSSEVEYAELKLARRVMAQFPLHKFGRLAPIMHRLRSVKKQAEITMLQEAVRITGAAFDRVMRMVKPGVMENEIEAEIIHTFVSNSASKHAYEPIIAGGVRACVLHYIENNQRVEDGELILMDFGADYAGYAADLTRVIPANGTFTARQKAVYNAVKRVHEGAKALLKPGISLPEHQQYVVELMEKELVDLKLIGLEETLAKNRNQAVPAYRRYFYHNTSHPLGLDVHDVGNRYMPIVEGMVLTCEPGIYIKEEGIGIRLENDVVIGKDGIALDLMANIPMEVEAIEEIMNAGK